MLILCHPPPLPEVFDPATAQKPHSHRLVPIWFSSLGPPPTWPGFQGGYPRSSSSSYSVAAAVAAMIKNLISPPPAAAAAAAGLKMQQVPVGLRTIDAFVWLGRIGSGSYGVVSRAQDRASGEVVAIKAVKMDVSTLREIVCFSSIVPHHRSVVRLKEIVTCERGGVYMVMEHMEMDLRSLLVSMPEPFDEFHTRMIMFQLLHGVRHLHQSGILHQDLKTPNLLINRRGAIKICDFGLCRRFYGRPLRYTRPVATLFYRPPELLLPGPKSEYSAAVDMWAVGCIMAELLVKEPLFRGRDDADQMSKIVGILGKPEENSVSERRFRLQEQLLPVSPLSTDGLDLLTQLLAHNPDERITADAALSHPWFIHVPLHLQFDF